MTAIVPWKVTYWSSGVRYRVDRWNVTENATFTLCRTAFWQVGKYLHVCDMVRLVEQANNISWKCTKATKHKCNWINLRIPQTHGNLSRDREVGERKKIGRHCTRFFSLISRTTDDVNACSMFVVQMDWRCRHCFVRATVYLLTQWLSRFYENICLLFSVYAKTESLQKQTRRAPTICRAQFLLCARLQWFSIERQTRKWNS